MNSHYKIHRPYLIIKNVDDEFKKRMIKVCNDKIQTKGLDVGLSFYAFFANKNDNPELLLEVAKWWILTNKLDHFEKAAKIKKLLATV